MSAESRRTPYADGHGKEQHKHLKQTPSGWSAGLSGFNGTSSTAWLYQAVENLLSSAKKGYIKKLLIIL